MSYLTNQILRGAETIKRMTNTNTPRTDEKKWCAYCGVWSEHQSGYCVRLLRDREEVLSAQLAASNCALDQMTEDAVKLKAEVERLKSMIERAMGPCSWPEYETTKELPND